ncbi:TatD family hydrolase [Mycoplasma sp. 1654_15]|uniref:TatD family hydrolase n=1 Tax=Mycoplasma sp. 1654_15 TaxID=2725994 RepID=UPI001449D634|nr:TatD family hydrolase [Mycoplasma sp. 1654_15]QJB71469.1 TatD family hydrolase [Mycoplasma sp. 1654_15]
MNWQFVKPTPKYSSKYEISFKNEANLFPSISKLTKDSFKIYESNDKLFWEFLLVDEDNEFKEVGAYLNIVKEEKQAFFTINIKINSLLNEEKWSILIFEYIHCFFQEVLKFEQKLINLKLDSKFFNLIKNDFNFQEVTKQNEKYLVLLDTKISYSFSDVHTHPFLEYYSEPKQEIEENIKNNLKTLFLIGTSWKDNEEIVSYLDKQKNLFALIGIHPNNVQKEDNYEQLEELLLKNSNVVGIGEVGLDLYYEESPSLDLQIQSLIKQIEIAKKYEKTVMLHIRENANEKDFFLFKQIKKIITNYLDVNFIFHNFSGNLEIYNEFNKFSNVFFSFSGVITYKNNKEARKILEIMDLDKLLLETDAPYLSPEPTRSLWPNHSYCIKPSYNLISRIRQISLLTLTSQINKNIERIFKVKLYE